ncbi:MAG: hypothetical protein ACI8W7_002494 [Gammaproteobacteria bacterium]|jgi:hypothetical protein
METISPRAPPSIIPPQFFVIMSRHPQVRFEQGICDRIGARHGPAVRDRRLITARHTKDRREQRAEPPANAAHARCSLLKEEVCRLRGLCQPNRGAALTA